jgi:hypothetical protein
MTLLAPNLLAPFAATISLAAARLDGLSPLAVLSRGYSIAYDQDGHVIDTVDAVDLDERLRIRLADGSLECAVEGKRHESLAKSLKEDSMEGPREGLTKGFAEEGLAETLKETITEAEHD